MPKPSRYLLFFLLPLSFCLLAQAQSAAASPGAKKQLLWEKLEQTIQAADRDFDGILAVSVRDLTDGQTFLYHADEIMPTASSIKIAVLAELYRQHQQGKLKLTDLYTVDARDLVPDSDILGGLTAGVTRLTLRDVATAMIAVSDNSATNILMDRVGMDNVNALLASLGLKDTRLRRKMMDLAAAQQGRENVATPREMMLLLDALHHERVLNHELTADFFKMLATHKDSAFRRALPDSVRSADKPGELEGVRNDVGIIYATNRPFILCVMTTYDAHERRAHDLIGRLAVAAYEMFERIGRASDYGRVISPGNSTPPK